MPLFKKLLLCFSLTFAFAGLSAAELKIKLSGFENQAGFYRLALFDNEAAYEGEAGNEVGTAVFNAVGRLFALETTLTVNLPAGDYAIKVFHDEDGNQKITTNLLGIPKEAFGFSNNASGSFGPPRYEKAVFTLKEGTVNLQDIELQ